MCVCVCVCVCVCSADFVNVLLLELKALGLFDALALLTNEVDSRQRMTSLLQLQHTTGS